jgi:Lon protease-like protein
MCPFDPAEKQALLEAPSFQERVVTLMAILEMARSGFGPQTLN